jgi:hypothetical protein
VPVVTRGLRFGSVVILTVTLCAYLTDTIGYSLEPGSSRWHGVDAVARTDGSGTEVRFAFRPRGQITFGFSIRNPGPWPVTITGVGGAPADQGPLKVTRLGVNQAEEAGAAVFDPAAATSFSSAKVDAGEELPVFVTLTIPDVPMSSGSGLSIDSLGATYEVLGVPRHQRVPMGFRLLVHSVNGHIPR